MKKITSLVIIALFAFQTPAANLPLDAGLAPVTLSVLGYQHAGFYGALTGLAVGCTDEVLVQVGVTERHYLTAGMMGLFGTSSQASSAMTGALGFLSGLMLATGKLNHLIDKAGSAFSTGLIGYTYGGVPGGVGGAICGVIDEVAQHYNVTSKPYLGNMIYGISGVSLFAPWASKMGVVTPEVFAGMPFKEIVGAAVGAYISTRESQSVQTSPVQLADELYALFSRVVDKETLDSMIEHQAIALVANKIFWVKLHRSVMLHYQDINAGFEGLGNTNGVHMAYQKFMVAVVGLMLLMPVQFAGTMAFETAQEFLGLRLSVHVLDGARDRYLADEVPLKLASDVNSRMLVDRMYENLRKSTLDGNRALSDALSSFAGAAFNTRFLLENNGVDLIVYLQIYSRINQFVESALTRWVESYTPAWNEGMQIVNELRKELLQDPHLIVPAGKTSLVRAKLERSIDDLHGIQDMQAAAEITLRNWHEVQGTIDWVVLKTFLIAAMIVQSKIKFENRFLMIKAVEDVSGAMTFGVKNARRLEKIGFAMDSVNDLLNRFENTTTRTGQRINYAHTKSDEIAVDIKNVRVGVDDALLVSEPNLTLPRAIYAATGKSGCGKSAFLSKLKGVVHNQFWATGDIRYLTPSGEAPNIMLITQKDYLTPSSSLLELVLSKPFEHIDVAAEKPRALALLKELDFMPNGDDEQLETWLTKEQDYAKILSGGQQKKVSVVAAIMAKPDILILDEVFNGMDKRVLGIAQKMIQRDLPNTLIVVVDHHAFDNNGSGFYDHELHFANQKIELAPVQQRVTSDQSTEI